MLFNTHNTWFSRQHMIFFIYILLWFLKKNGKTIYIHTCKYILINLYSNTSNQGCVVASKFTGSNCDLNDFNKNLFCQRIKELVRKYKNQRN